MHEGRKLEVRAVLESLPRFAMLPSKGPENNHRADGASLQYKNYRSLQNSIAHVLRILAASYVAGHPAEGEKFSVLFQQGWQLVLEVFEKSAHCAEREVSQDKSQRTKSCCWVNKRCPKWRFSKE